MADQQTVDPIEAVLKMAPANNSVRGDAWDAYQAASSPDELSAKLKDMALPQKVKAALWDLKAGVTTAPQKKAESAGPFDPETAGFGGRVVNAAVDVPVGMVKGAAQGAYAAIPDLKQNVADVFGLPIDSPAMNWTDATNDTQRAGKAIDVGIALAAGGSLPIRTVTPYVTAGGTKLGIVNDATVASRLGQTSMAMLQGAKDEVFSGPPLTANRIGHLVGKYGLKAVEYAVGGVIGVEAAKHIKNLPIVRDLLDEK